MTQATLGMPEEWGPLAEVGEELGIPPRLLGVAVDKGTIKARKVRGRWIIERESAKRYAEFLERVRSRRDEHRSTHEIQRIQRMLREQR